MLYLGFGNPSYSVSYGLWVVGKSRDLEIPPTEESMVSDQELGFGNPLQRTTV